MRAVWRLGVTAILAVAVAVAAGCSGEGDGFWKTHAGAGGEEKARESAGAGSGQEEDADRVKRIVAKFAELRDVDPCALLDREVISRITEAKVGVNIPGRHLSECHVDTEIDEIELGWSFQVFVGVLYKARETTRKEEIDGEEFFVDADEYSCQYTRKVTPEIGVVLTATAPPLNEAGDDPCEMTRSYISAALKRFTTMGLRDQRITKPQLPLASHDPCEAVPAVAQAMGTQATGAPVSTYLCSIASDPADAESPLADQNLSISYEFITDPREDVPDDPKAASPEAESLGSWTAVTIAGRPGAQFDGTGDIGCSQNVVLDEKHVVKDDTLTYVQVVSVLAKDCEVSKRAAETVLTRLGGT